MFIGRKEELQFLEEKYNADGGQLIVIYRRRRVGKTETIRKFCEDKPHVFYTCVECPDGKQLKSFSRRMLQIGIPEDAKKILVIDEFPYMVKGNNSIPSMIQKIWDEQLKKENIMIILCGSAMSFIEKEILSEKNPLYGRATGILKMNEMNFYDAIQFIPAYSVEDKIKTYAVLGGIPHYLKQFDDKLSLEENIQKNILTRGSILYSEVEFLLRQELRETSIYNVIIEAVALGNTKLNDIYQKTQIEKTKLTVYLKNLMDLRIIYREFPVDESIKEHANVQRGLYKVTDNFFRFWYAFVFPNMSELEVGDSKGILEYAVLPELDNYVSYVFEDICREYLRHKNVKEMLPFHFTKIGRWWNKTDEIDIVATDFSKTNYILGECKYKKTTFSMSDLRKLQQKFSTNRNGYKIYYWIFSKGGCTEEVIKAAEGERVYIVNLEDLVD